MVAQSEASALKDNQLLKNLAKLGIPENFPMGSPRCRRTRSNSASSRTLADARRFCIFAQGMSQNVIVGGDFRKLLNALSHVDESSLAESLPFRMGARGLHLPRRSCRRPAPRRRLKRAAQAIDWFKDDYAALQKDLKAGGTMQRWLQVLGNPDAEKRAADMMAAHLKGGGAPGAKKSGLFGSLGRLFGK
jgi:hypothetical protein